MIRRKPIREMPVSTVRPKSVYNIPGSRLKVVEPFCVRTTASAQSKPEEGQDVRRGGTRQQRVDFESILHGGSGRERS